MIKNAWPIVRAGLLLAILGALSIIVGAQGRSPEPVVPLPNLEGEVQRLSAEYLASLPLVEATREEADGALPLPPPAGSVVPPPEAFDLDARLSLPDRATRATTFTLTYFGDTQANDISPGDGICADMFGMCGLRTAIQEANALPGLDVILIPAVQITLNTSGAEEDAAASGDLDITDSLIIRGVGAKQSIIFGNRAITNDRVFHVYQTSPTAYITLDLIDLSIYGGQISGSSGGGLFVRCGADVVVRRVNVFDNIASFGGGIAASGSGCSTSFFPRLTVYESAVFRNTNNSNLAGGGIESFGGGRFNLINSTVALNVNQTLSTSAGAGVYISSNVNSFANIINSTIIDNTMPAVTSGTPGVGIYIGSTSTTTLTDSIVAFNTFNGGTGISNCAGGGGTSAGGNAYSNSAGCPLTSNDITSSAFSLVDPIFFNSPGQTPTGFISSTSAARASGKTCTLPTDQRGIERPVRDCSSGAFQYVSFVNEPPQEFTLLSPAIVYSRIVSEFKWIQPRTVVNTYLVIVRDVNGVELFRVAGLTPGADADLLTCATIGDNDTLENVYQNICTLTLTRAQWRRFLPYDTYEWEVRAIGSEGTTAVRTNFLLTPTVPNYLFNGGFENDLDSNNVPDGWTAARRKQDARVCNTIDTTVSFSGTCAYQLVGEANKNSLLRQTYNQIVTPETVFVVGGFSRSIGKASGATVTIQIGYSDGSVQTKVITLRRSPAYQPLTFSNPNPTLRVTRSGATSFAVLIKNTGTAGRFLIDDFTLGILTP